MKYPKPNFFCKLVSKLVSFHALNCAHSTERKKDYRLTE